MKTSIVKHFQPGFGNEWHFEAKAIFFTLVERFSFLTCIHPYELTLTSDGIERQKVCSKMYTTVYFNRCRTEHLPLSA